MASVPMPPRPPHSLARHWWFVFALFIATPAIMLALLGIGVIRADEIQRREVVEDQQANVARLAGAALWTTLQREEDDARYRPQSSDAATVDRGSIHFELEPDNIAFPAHRVYVLHSGLTPPTWAFTPLAPATALLVERAQAAEAQGRLPVSRALYEQLRASDRTREWAGLQLSMLPAVDPAGARTSVAPDVRLADSDARSPSGIPLAIVASSFMDASAPGVRQQFGPLLEQTLRSLRAGRWWMSLEQRRVYDDVLREWMRKVSPTRAEDSPDRQVESIERAAALVVEAFDEAGGAPPRAQLVGDEDTRVLVVWTRPDRVARKWSGVAIPRDRADVLVAASIRPLLEDQPFQVALQQRDTVLWSSGPPPAAAGLESLPLEDMAGWTLAFSSGPVRPNDWRRLLNYGRVIFPMVVLACGLLMTAWIIRREMALVEMQASFAAAVTHEFKSPITSIRLLMERISSGRLQSAEATDRYYAAIRIETDRLEALVNRLLEAQKFQVGQKDYVFRTASIDAIVREAIDAMGPQAEAKQITVVLQCAAAVPTALALDTESMADAIRNLLDNAIKYSPEGAPVAVSIVAQDDELRLVVSDEGVGVDPREADRIFEPFYRSRRGDHANVHGTGLGLALVKATAEAHGGSIAVSSDGVRGSRFTLTLPLGQAPPDSARIAVAATTPQLIGHGDDHSMPSEVTPR
jgi:signal transduction histidine kinase